MGATKTTKQTYLAYLNGKATLEDVTAAADAVLTKFAATHDAKQPPKQ